MAEIPPVLIVGAGPTGMTAALDLAYHGIPSIILDEDHTLSAGSRAIAFHHTALAVWERLGAADAMLQKGIAWSARHTYFRDKHLYTQQFTQPGEGFLPHFINLQQYYVELYLLQRIEASPLIELLWDHRVTGLQAGEEGVTLKIESPQGPRQLSGPYVLACDGARSTLRKLLNLDFPGVTHHDHFLIADIRADLDFPCEPRFFFDHPTNPGQTILIHPQPDGIWRIDWQVGSEGDIQAERSTGRMDTRIRALIGDTPYEIVWLSDYRFHQRLLAQFRHGRVFFLGDAAHLVAPFGARGMNSAIQDVENLVWKLALVLRGAAPEALLDTYQAERWPAQSHNQEVTRTTMRFMAPPNRLLRWKREAILRLSIFYPPARRWVNSGKMSEAFTYSDSPLLVQDEETPADWLPGVALGAKVPDAPCTLFNGLMQPTFLRKLLGGSFVALYFAETAAEGQAFVYQASEAAAAQAGEVPLRIYALVPHPSLESRALPALLDEAGELGRLLGGIPGSFFLIRPDGHVAVRRRQVTPQQVGEFLARACALA